MNDRSMCLIYKDDSIFLPYTVQMIEVPHDVATVLGNEYKGDKVICPLEMPFNYGIVCPNAMTTKLSPSVITNIFISR